MPDIDLPKGLSYQSMDNYVALQPTTALVEKANFVLSLVKRITQEMERRGIPWKIDEWDFIVGEPRPVIDSTGERMTTGGLPRSEQL